MHYSYTQFFLPTISIHFIYIITSHLHSYSKDSNSLEHWWLLLNRGDVFIKVPMSLTSVAPLNLES